MADAIKCGWFQDPRLTWFLFFSRPDHTPKEIAFQRAPSGDRFCSQACSLERRNVGRGDGGRRDNGAAPGPWKTG